jgi:hypothetical protein
MSQIRSPKSEVRNPKFERHLQVVAQVEKRDPDKGGKGGRGTVIPTATPNTNATNIQQIASTLSIMLFLAWRPLSRLRLTELSQFDFGFRIWDFLSDPGPS